MKRILSVLFVVALVFSLFSGSIYSERAYAASKISDNLMAAYDEMDSSSSTLVYVEMRDVDEETVLTEFARRYPDEHALYTMVKFGDSSITISAEQEELLDQAILHKRQIYKEYYSNSNQQIVDRYFSEDAQLFVSSYAPVAIVEASENSTWAMARSSDIVALYAFEVAEFYPDASISEDVNNTEVITDKFIDDLVLANQISRADIVRDTHGLTGEGVKVGILEANGVPDTTNPYLNSANITINPDYTIIDDHATNVTAIMAASNYAGAYGIVPEAEYYCCAIEGSYNLFSSTEWLLDCGVNVINASLSWYNRLGYYDSYSAWLDHIAVLHDVHFAKSAGNYNSTKNPNHMVASPGMAYNAITVGSFDAYSDDVSTFTLSPYGCYVETEGSGPEKPNLVAKANLDSVGASSYATPQVAGVITQLCDYNPTLKYKQSAIGAILAASAAEKVEAVGSGAKGDVFFDPLAGSVQISDKEGAGILDALWAWGVVSNLNWLGMQVSEFPYTQTFTVNTSMNTLTRISIFWLKKNVNYSHESDAETGTNANIANLDLYIYDSDGDLVTSSTMSYGNFEIVQFVPEGDGVYTIVVTGSTNNLEHVGLAIW